MRKKLVAANWKMNLTLDQVNHFLAELDLNTVKNSNCDVQIYCPSIYIGKLLSAKVVAGAQNIYFEKSGAFTGEISGSQLKSMDCTHVLIGHSERRSLFHESHDIVKRKLKTSIELGLNPILCVGEPLEIRQKNTHLDFVQSQLSDSLSDFGSENLINITIAYEPVWAIGTGLTAEVAQIEEMHTFIRKYLLETFGAVSDNIRILYGGSCNDQNAKAVFSINNVDGGLIGGASLEAIKFMKIISAAHELS